MEPYVLSIIAINKIIEMAVLYYQTNGSVPTYEALEAANDLTDLKIERLMQE